MDKQDYKMDMRVGLVSKTYPSRKGKIAGPVLELNSPRFPHGDTVIVEWDSGGLQMVTLRSLLSEADALAQDTKLQEDESRLEKEFEAVQNTVAGKIAE